MKFGCFFLFLTFLLVNFQASDSVKCPFLPDRLDSNADGFATCSSCVIYSCNKNGVVLSGPGCPEDFFRICAGVDGVELIRSKNYNDLQYRKYDTVKYISGCGEEQDGTSCIAEKKQKFYSILDGNTNDHCIEAGSPCVIGVDSKNGAQKMNGILGIGLMILAWIF